MITRVSLKPDSVEFNLFKASDLYRQSLIRIIVTL